MDAVKRCLLDRLNRRCCPMALTAQSFSSHNRLSRIQIHPWHIQIWKICWCHSFLKVQVFVCCICKTASLDNETWHTISALLPHPTLGISFTCFEACLGSSPFFMGSYSGHPHAPPIFLSSLAYRSWFSSLLPPYPIPYPIKSSLLIE